jgi:integrase
MSFIKSETRKTIKAEKISDITLIDFKDKYIHTSNGIADFNRLYFIGCPILPIKGKKISIPKNQGVLKDANRRQTINRLYVIITTMDRADRSKFNLFSTLVSFLRMMDSKNIENPFKFQSIKIYMESLAQNYRDGIKGKTLSIHQGLLKTIIKEIDMDLFYDCENLFIPFPDDVEHAQPYTDENIKTIASALYIIYKDYSKHIFNETTPEIFPLYPESKIQGVEKFNFKENRKNRRPTSYKTNSNIWKADLSRVAYFLTCFYTGINSSQLLDIKHSDITEEPFKSINRKTYTLKSIKGRQANKTNYSDVGFSKKAKLFLESWILISKKINSNIGNGFLFPNIHNDRIYKMTVTAVSNINSVLLDFEIPALTSKRFRKTKASLIMRSTESIFMVAQGLNNSIETASKYYSDGDNVTTEFSLASALYVRERAAIGGSLEQAILDSSYIFKDPVREKKLSLKNKKLMNGLRCSENYGEKSKKLKDLLMKENLASENDTVACYKFLDCFGCKFHAVVAEVEDIWLLLSFNDVILESASRPSANSTPTKLLEKVNNTIQAIIIKIKKDNLNIYNEAYEKYLKSPHPLWENSDDLNLIMDIY